MNKGLQLFGKHRILTAGIFVAAIAVAVIVPTLVLGQAPPPPPGPPSEHPATRMPPPPAVVDKEALERADVELRKGLTDRAKIDETKTLVALAGPGTRGKTITIAGREVKLPPDAELAGLALIAEPSLEVPSGYTPLKYPLLRILRGNTVIFVSVETGRFDVKRGRRADFQFLLDALGSDKLNFVEE
jgi:hypothetical protein